jgi:hypothetical protein
MPPTPTGSSLRGGGSGSGGGGGGGGGFLGLSGGISGGSGVDLHSGTGDERGGSVRDAQRWRAEAVAGEQRRGAAAHAMRALRRLAGRSPACASHIAASDDVLRGAVRLLLWGAPPLAAAAAGLVAALGARHPRAGHLSRPACRSC